MSWELWGLSTQTGEILTKDLRLSHLIDKLSASVDHVISEKHQDEFKSLLSLARKTAEKRNTLLHSLWIVHNGKPIICVDRKRGILGDKDIAVEEIEKFNSEIIDLTFLFIEFEKKHQNLGLGLNLDSSTK